MKNNFEDTIKQLEEIVKELESDELDLDSSVEKFEKGMQLSKQCTKILEEAEKRITILINKDGESVVSNDNIWDGWNSSGAITRTDTYTNVPTSIISTLQTIRIEWDANSYSGDLYYRATEKNPQILTINFFQPGASY